MNIHRIRTDWQERYHLQLDADATVLDCFVVELPPYFRGAPCYFSGFLENKEGLTMDELFARALRTLAWLRTQTTNPIHPPTVFNPFGVITARNKEDVRREGDLKMKMYLGQHSHDHDERVRLLCEAWDLLDGQPLPSIVPWPKLKMPN